MTTIAFLSPAKAPFYLSPLTHLTDCFCKLGFTVLFPRPVSTEQELALFIQSSRPDIIFDINRLKSDWEYTNLSHIIYITWVIDTWGRDISKLGASDIVYFFLKEWLHSYQHSDNFIKDYFIPGTIISNTPRAARRTLYDWIFAGHMPSPWDDKELNRQVQLKNGCYTSFRSIVEIVAKDSISYRYFWTDEQFLLFLNSHLQKQYATELMPLTEGSLRYDLGHRINRQLRRHMFIRAAITMSDSCCLLGSEGWQQWPEFKDKYSGFIPPEKLAQYNNTSKMILHEGPGIHFRLLDAMGAGCPVLVHNLQGQDGTETLLQYFDDDRDLIVSSLEEIKDKGRYYLQHGEQLTQIGKNGLMRVQSNHLWMHRAQQVTHDINRIHTH